MDITKITPDEYRVKLTRELKWYFDKLSRDECKQIARWMIRNTQDIIHDNIIVNHNKEVNPSSVLFFLQQTIDKINKQS